VGWNPGDGNFYVVDRQVVSRDGWTQIAACQKIAELNRYWHPQFIYVDKGFGHMQVEILHKYGYDAIADAKRGPMHPDSKLCRIVKSYDFGSTIEIRDPFNKQLVPKPAKPFLVESSVRRFETRTIKYPKSDEQLTKALLGYRIKRISPSGVPVYEQGNPNAGDHFLDALNLALVAFTLEESDFGKPKYTTELVISPNGLNEIIYTEGKDGASKRETGRPQMNRSLTTRVSSVLGRNMPISNSTRGDMGVWDWPGFSHDAPKPQPSNPRSVEGTLRGRLPFRPKRKNII
jgi:hypothetical protein